MLAALATVLAVATLPATNVTNTTATFNGTDDSHTTTHFEYGTTGYDLSTPPVQIVDGEAHFDATGLTPNTTYHYRIAGASDDEQFTTKPNPKPPTLGDQHASAVTGSSAHLSATLNPQGAQTTYYFQYGRSTSYGNRTARLTLPAGTEA